MTSKLEQAKKKLQLIKLRTAKEEFLVKIMEREAEIERLHGEIEKQDKAIKELETELKE